MRNFLLSLLLMLGLGACANSNNNAGTRGIQITPQQHVIGLETYIWPFMWKNGLSLTGSSELSSEQELRWRFSVNNLDRYSELGAAWNIVHLFQQDDAPDIALARAKRIVREHEKRGIDVVFRIIEDPRIYLSSEPERDRFLEQYRQWLRRLASEFQQDVNIWLIGNEMDHAQELRLRAPALKAVTYNDYRRVLATARSAVAGHESIYLADAGISFSTLRLLLARNTEHGTNIGRAVNYRSAAARRRLEFAEQSIDDNGLLDLRQLHYYGPSEALPFAAELLQQHSPSVPLIASEIGYRVPRHAASAGRAVPDWSRYSEIDHAQALVRSLSRAMHAGAELVLYWQIRWHHNKNITAHLYRSTSDPAEFLPTRAASAFKILTGVVHGRRRTDVKLFATDNVFELAFADGERGIAIVWRTGSGEILFKDEVIVHAIRNEIGEESESLSQILNKPLTPAFVEFALR